jgi:hypothetical protein
MVTNWMAVRQVRMIEHPPFLPDLHWLTFSSSPGITLIWMALKMDVAVPLGVIYI